MAKAAFRHLTPGGTRPNEPLAAGIGAFGDSLNQALIRNQQNKQAQDMAQGKQKSALELAMERFYNQKALAEDDKKVAPMTNPKSKPKASTRDQTGLNRGEQQFMALWKSHEGRVKDAVKSFFDPTKQLMSGNQLTPDQKRQMVEKGFDDPANPELYSVRDSHQFLSDPKNEATYNKLISKIAPGSKESATPQTAMPGAPSTTTPDFQDNTPIFTQ